MEELDRYLDLYRVGDAVQRAVPSMRVGPETGFFNVPFPLMRSGLSGLGSTPLRVSPAPAPGTPLTDPGARLYERTGALVPDSAWLQRAINTLLPEGSRLEVDGVAGPLTLGATFNMWQAWSVTPAAVEARALAKRQDPASGPYVPRRTPAGIAIERAFLNSLVGRAAVADPPRRSAPRDGGGGGGGDVTPIEPLPPEPSTSGVGGGGALLLVAAAVAVGFYFSRRS